MPVRKRPRVLVQRLIRRVLRKPKIALLFAFRYDHEFVDGLIENIEELVDGVVSHDDRNRTEEWYHEGQLRAALIAKARHLGYDWVICVDPDERLEKGALKRIRSLVDGEKKGRKVIYGFNFRELWDPSAYRSDGIWGKKKKFVLFPLLGDQDFMNLRVHSPWHPVNSDYDFVETGFNLYHLKMIDPHARKQRADLYEKLDPDHEIQAIGYRYLEDEAGLELTAITPDRAYLPPYDRSIRINQL